MTPGWTMGRPSRLFRAPGTASVLPLILQLNTLLFCSAQAPYPCVDLGGGVPILFYLSFLTYHTLPNEQ